MVIATWTAGLALLLIGGWCARRIVAEARGLEKVVALSHAFFAAPLAVFGAEHLSGDQGILSLVPSYMPWRIFWFYFVGVALVAAALSLATGILVRWSGLLVGILMFLFVTLLWIPGSLSDPHNRIGWVIVCRESSFGAGAWALAGGAVPGWGPRARRIRRAPPRLQRRLELRTAGAGDIPRRQRRDDRGRVDRRRLSSARRTLRRARKAS